MAKTIKIFKIISIFICCLGFIYHSKDLFEEYISGKTVISLNFLVNRMDSLPTITVCLPQFYSLQKLSEINSVFKKNYSNYMEMTRSYLIQQSSGSHINNKSIRMQLSEMTRNMRSGINVYQNNVSAFDLTSKYSIPMRNSR